MKIIVVGDWHSDLHEEPVYKTLKKLGHEVLPFKWYRYFVAQNIDSVFIRPILKAQNKYMIGPVVNRINCDLVDVALREKPDIIIIYRGILIFRETLIDIKTGSSSTILVGYNNDDPFSGFYPVWKWRHFLPAIPEYDIVFAYRLQNIKDYISAGAKRVELLRSWLIPEINRPVNLTDEDQKKYDCDVVFVGHYEDDGRISYLEEVVRQGWRLRLFGHDYGWNSAIKKSPDLKHLYPLNTVWGEEYNKAISGARIALCFLSKLNRDTYTRRCFEIPASGTMLLSEYSDDLANLFAPGKEADYFSSLDEFKDKLFRYLRDPKLLNRVAAAGYERVVSDGHDVNSRVSQVLEHVARLKG